MPLVVVTRLPLMKGQSNAKIVKRVGERGGGMGNHHVHEVCQCEATKGCQE